MTRRSPGVSRAARRGLTSTRSTAGVRADEDAGGTEPDNRPPGGEQCGTVGHHVVEGDVGGLDPASQAVQLVAEHAGRLRTATGECQDRGPQLSHGSFPLYSSNMEK